MKNVVVWIWEWRFIMREKDILLVLDVSRGSYGFDVS